MPTKTIGHTLKRLGLLLLSVGICVVLFYVFEFGVLMGSWQPLLRPSGVSPEARYVSLDGKWETWFDCRIDASANVNHCKAWDRDGELLVDSDFRLDDAKRAANAAELRPTRLLTTEGKVYMICLSGASGGCTNSLIPVAPAAR